MTPGGIDWKVSVLLTTTVIRTCRRRPTWSVMSASNGVYPPSWLPTSVSSTHTVARCVADSKCSTTRRSLPAPRHPDHRWYQMSPK